MPNPKCPICKCYIQEQETKSSGEPYKSCKRCREIQKKQRAKKADEPETKKEDEPDVKKEPEMKEDGIVNIKGIEYDVKSKILDRKMAKKLIPDFDTKYDNLEDMPDENIVIPDECFKYVIGAKMNTEMMEKLGFRITTADEEDNNIYPDDGNNIIDNKVLEQIKKQSPVFIP